MKFTQLSSLLLLLVIVSVAVNAIPPRQRNKKPIAAQQGRGRAPKATGRNAKPGARYDAYDENEKPLDPLEPAGNKPSPEVTGETTHVTGTCKGTCVPYYLCQSGKIVEDGSGLIDPRTKPTPKNELPLDNGKTGICGTFDSCCTEPISQPPADLKYVHRCGVRSANGINRRVLTTTGKGESEFGEWPWQAAILKTEEGDSNLFVCGGVLINELFVLTVAHCVVNHLADYQLLKIRLGEWDTQNTNEFLPHDDYRVVAMFIHEEYRNSSLWNDIALLKLDKPVKFQLNIDTICLPDPTDVFEAHNCVTTGWGKNAYQGGSYSNILKEVSLPVVPHELCQQGLRTTRLGQRFRLHPGFTCAGGEAGIDSCKGDGGGPLSCYRKDGYYALAGLVSWGIECGKAGVPGVYIDVRKYLDWIYQKTGLDSRVFKPNKKVQ